MHKGGLMQEGIGVGRLEESTTGFGQGKTSFCLMKDPSSLRPPAGR